MNATTRDNGGLRQRDLDALARAEHANPFAVLGPHADGAGGLFVRAFLPTALNVQVLARHDGRVLAEMVQGIASEHGGEGFRWATKAEDRAKMWEARHAAAYACKALRKGCEIMATDVCVPISRLAECVTETQADLQATGLLGPIVGHVGDGNFHVALLVDGNDPREIEATENFLARLAERALRMGGTCTGEHGVGQGKMKYLLAEHGAPALAAMRAIKQALDPHDIMNAGKLVPADL